MRNLGAVCVITILVSAWSARADLTVVQAIEGAGEEMEGADHTGDVTVKIKGDKERIDAPPQPTQIIDGKAGELITLINNQKKFIRITADQLKAAAQTINKSEAETEAPSAKSLTPSGKTDTIHGYQAEEFIYQTPNFRASFWVAKKYPDAAAILKEMQGPFSGAWKASNMGMPNYTDFQGVPLRTVVSMGEKKIVTTVTSIKKGPISPGEFEIPKDFQELKKPLDFVPRPNASPASSASATP
jgi:hypothetical protein